MAADGGEVADHLGALAGYMESVPSTGRSALRRAKALSKLATVSSYDTAVYCVHSL